MGSVVGYARLSTVEQARGTLTLDQQVTRLKSAGAGEVLVDLMSGTSTARPKYRELLRRVKAGTVEKVVATRWDRLTRGAAETCKLVDVFSADGAPELELLDDDLNLSTIGGRLQLRMLGAMAQAEVERIRERAAAGKAHRLAMGLVDVAPWGTKQVGGRLQPDREPFLSLLADRQTRSTANLVLEMIGILEDKLSHHAAWRHLGETYGVWRDRAGIQRLLINPALRGARVGKRCKTLAVATWADVVEGAGGEPLVDPQRHRALEARIRGAQARRSAPDKRRQHVLSGKVICGHCGRKMGRYVRPGRNAPGTAAYRCLNEECNWRQAGKRRNTISESELFPAVFQAFADQADALAAAEERQAQQQDDAVASQPEVKRLQAKRQQYLQLMADGDAPELQSAVQVLDQQIAALMEAGTDWGLQGMPKLEAIRRDAAMNAGGLELLQRFPSGELEPGQEAVIHAPEPEGAVAKWWRAESSYLAGLQWSEEQIKRTIYEDVPDQIREGGTPLNPDDYTWKANPRLQLIREVVQQLRVEEKAVVGVTLNV